MFAFDTVMLIYKTWNVKNVVAHVEFTFHVD